MPPNLSPPTPDEPSQGAAVEPLLQVIEDLAPTPLHSAAWKVCSGKHWYFGHGSHDGDWQRFWKMDLDGEGAFKAIWEHVRPRCEALAGAPLRVVRQYANGHTYGLGGQPHRDDDIPGSFTLLYYPNPEWREGWEGETVFYDEAGEIALAVRPRPNRGIFFDSRILHAGRAPSRLCPALRVTVVYKLQAVAAPAGDIAQEAAVPASPAPATDSPGTEAEVSCSEVMEKREGAIRVYHLRVSSPVISRAVEEQLAGLGKNVRLPGFRPGRIPMTVLQQRYGAQARSEAIEHIAADMAQKSLPKSSVVSSLTLRAGAESGDVEFEAAVAYLPDLPAADFSTVSIDRLHASTEDLKAAGLSDADAGALFRRHLKLQVLDRLDAAYPIPVAPFLVEREFGTIWKAAESQGEIPVGAAERKALAAEFRAISERRVRLGMVVAEIAHRNEISAPRPAEFEDKVVDLLVARSRVHERQLGVEELRQLIAEE